jgi:hypothetical protein
MQPTQFGEIRFHQSRQKEAITAQIVAEQNALSAVIEKEMSMPTAQRAGFGERFF